MITLRKKQMELFEKSQITLELPSVLELLAAEAVSAPAKEKARGLKPAVEKTEVARRLGETTAAKAMITIKGSPSFSGLKDICSSLMRADMGGMLNTRELLDIAGVLQSARLVKAYGSASECGRSDIDFLFGSLIPNRFLEEKITTSIAGDDEIADAASAELADIRRLMRAAGARAREALQKIISSPSYSKALQEPIITMRSDRYVVPVKVEYKSAVPGLTHDVSASGATLFIEPMAVVKANNELRELSAREKQEIDRILMELSADCAGYRDEITCDYNVLVALDLIFAKGRLSFLLDCDEPELSDAALRFKKARHPLLEKEKAVPIDVSLGDEFDTLVITGPNTGGKTVTLKTLGLLCLMAQCGLHIPAGHGSCVPVYKKILADIGDEQSIEQSLSTFSSHMTNIVKILDECGEGSLLLFDELGAGTDPVEGAALAIAVIERARGSGVCIAATTHYAELKVYATETGGVQNASCEFDVETLRPTYRLLIGIPGKSNAFAISERLGLDKSVIDDAKNRVGAENRSFEATIERLERERLSLEKNRADAEKMLRDAEANSNKSDRLLRELTVRLDKADEKARRDAARILEDARLEAEAVFRELDEMRRLQAQEEDHRLVNEARSKLRQRLNTATENLSAGNQAPEPQRKSDRALKPGDIVEIIGMGVKATVLTVSGDGALSLKAGAMKVAARESEVFLLEGEQAEETKIRPEKSAAQLRSAPSAELDIRGMTADEAIPIVERFVDGAVLGKLNTVTIIHGKGTGVLRQAVKESLKAERHVRSFRLGRFGEGEDGVTIVELK